MVDCFTTEAIWSLAKAFFSNLEKMMALLGWAVSLPKESDLVSPWLECHHRREVMNKNFVIKICLQKDMNIDSNSASGKFCGLRIFTVSNSQFFFLKHVGKYLF